MKRMNEIFDLPVTDKNLTHVANYTSLEDDMAIIHVINHVDNLADALEGCMNAIAYNATISEKAIEQYMVAKAALAAYRGEK